ncbi:MAG: hypothetical protein LUB61_07370 [Eggerthellaceae bacterium]|nr:hypothetical protein [Eggerthellaceae bacterium]
MVQPNNSPGHHPEDGQTSDIETYKYHVARLEKENLYLKNLLDDAGISYDLQTAEEENRQVPVCPQLPDQRNRILSRQVTEQDAVNFYKMFWGRVDVFAKRIENKNTGKVGYYPQCENFWKSCCPRKQKSSIRCQDCSHKKYKRLNRAQIVSHLSCSPSETPTVIGIYPLHEDGTCRFIVFDFDNHEKDSQDSDFANKDNEWKDEVDALRKVCKINGIDALVERSRSGKGAHLWIFFQKPIDALLARRFGIALLKKGSESVNNKSFRYFDRMLPMQDHLEKGQLGNLIALPLQSDALKNGNSAFVDDNWNAYPDQWSVLLRKQKYSEDFIKAMIKEWTNSGAFNIDNIFNEVFP